MPPKRNPAKPYSKYRSKLSTAVELPPECSRPAPPVPPGRDWSESERELWGELWRSPQACQWAEANITAVAMYVAHSSAVLSGEASAWQAQEARHLGDRLGLTPQGMSALGWRVAEDAGPEERARPSSSGRRPSARDRLRVVDPGLVRDPRDARLAE